MRLKVGDKVRVRKDLEYGIYTSSDGKYRDGVTDEMLRYKGKVAIVTNIYEDGGIEINSNDWNWVDTMFEEVEDNKSLELKPGMSVHCDTKEKSKIFLQECERQGVTCCSGEVATSLNVWDQLKEKTCYAIYGGKTRTGGKPYLEFDNVNYYKYKTLGFNVLEFDELFKEQTLSENEKVEDIRKFRKTKYEVVYDKPDFIHVDVEKVMTNDNTTIVILETGEKGIAKCSPRDNFNLLVGYNIAYSRARIKYFKNVIIDEKSNIEYLTEGDF